MNQIQIGVIGSMMDTKISEIIQNTARVLGEEIALHHATLLFGYEGDFNSLSEIAARTAEDRGGKTIAFLSGTNATDLNGLHSVKIVTGQLRTGGREFALVLSCDVIICIGGGSGSLTEIAFAYQNNIPVIVLEDTGGWSDKLANSFLDDRKRMKIIGVKSPQEAVILAISLSKK